MASCTDQPNGLNRDGISQAQRGLAALAPGSARVDERGVNDFLAFALAFSRHVVHHDLNGSVGDWEPFFGCDAAAIIAAIARHNPLPMRDAWRGLTAAPATVQTLAAMIRQLETGARLLDGWYRSTGGAAGFREQVRKRIRANLPATMCRLVQYYLALVAEFTELPPLELSDLSDAWALGAEGCERRPDATLFGAQAGAELLSAEQARAELLSAAQAALSPLFAPLYRVMVDLIGIAPAHFDSALTARQDHEPHFALFVTFLRLYLLIRDDANRLTQRHLDFFYQRVLGIERRPAQPDHLHVLVTLARQAQDQHRLGVGTALDAGKDSAGIPLRYALDRDLIVNRVEVAELKTVFVQRDSTEGSGPAVQGVVKRITAAPVANSQDGLGAEIEDEARPSWSPFGNPRMPAAVLGFALASRTLLLAEGKRTIELELHAGTLPTGLTQAGLDRALLVQLSGEKGWITPPPAAVSVELLTNNALVIRVELDSTQPAVTLADAAILGEDYGTDLPLLKITLIPPAADPGTPFVYELLEAIGLARVVLRTIAEGITTLVVQNDTSALDPAKPFRPFGPAPRKGANLYVGCQEAFQKDLDGLTLHLTWDLLPVNSFAEHYRAYAVTAAKLAMNGFTLTAKVIQDGNAIDVVPASQALFTGTNEVPNPLRDLMFTDLGDQAPRVIGGPAPWTPATQHGFLRLTLGEQGFLHDRYVPTLTVQSIAMARLPDCTAGASYIKVADGTQSKCPFPAGTAAGDYEALLPNEPYTPTVKAISLDYRASVDTARAPGDLRLFHIEPFGRVPVGLPDAATKPPLLPQLQDEGTLYIGLGKLAPRQGLALLFQVAEGSADSDLDQPELKWDYLANDAWSVLKSEWIRSDDTGGLIRSGVIELSMPPDISPARLRLPKDLFWLRLRAERDSGAVSELIAIHTQAVRATLSGSANAPDHLSQPLPANKVAALVSDDAAIAGISQPYPSFGARPAEASTTFYTRVAELLRHKGRAITLFDYERLILERFPALYKVKCIGHTDADDAQAPGHVLIAVVADFRKLKAVDRSRPKVTRSTLEEIAAYVRTLNCPFVCNVPIRPGETVRERLHLVNPRYEEVRVAFNVRFAAGVSSVDFQIAELQREINAFLSPWASDDGVEIAFGGWVHKSSILSFVEQRKYVDYVTDFVMTHDQKADDLEAIEAATPRSILVPAATHGIDAIVTEPFCQVTATRPGTGRIGDLTIGRDFTITAAEQETQ